MRSYKGAEHLSQAAESEDWHLESDTVKEDKLLSGSEGGQSKKDQEKFFFWNQQDVIALSKPSEKNNIVIKMRLNYQTGTTMA